MFVVRWRKVFNLLKKENLPYLFVYVIIITIVTSIVFYQFEGGKTDGGNRINENINSYYDSLWWTVVTFTTVGYGDISPKTPSGKVIAIFAMFLGIGFIGTFMATIASITIQARGKEIKGMQKIKLKDHLIICGYNKLKVERFIEEFRSEIDYKNIPIVLVTNSIEEHPLQDETNVYFVRGESTDETVLERAAIKDASRVIVMAESNQDTSADEKTILTILLVKEINPSIYVCAEVLSPRKKGFLLRAHCDEVIIPSEITVNLMVQALQDPGVTQVVEELISNTYGQQFQKSRLEPQFFKKTFHDLVIELIKEEHIVFAIQRNGENMINPINDYILEQDDEYFYISKSRRK